MLGVGNEHCRQESARDREQFGNLGLREPVVDVARTSV